MASSADVDPALVMRHLGSQRGLFTRAVRAAPAPQAPGDGEALLDQLPATLGVRLGGLPDGAVAMLRCMLTDPASADDAREALGRRIAVAGIEGALPADGDEDGGNGTDGELRAD